MESKKTSQGKRDWHFSMSVALGVGLGIFVLTSVAGVLGIGLVAGYQNTADLLNQKAELIINSESEQISYYLQAAQDQVAFIAKQSSRGDVDPGRSVEFVSLLHGAISATPQIIRIQFIDMENRLTGVERLEDETMPIFQRVGDDGALEQMVGEAKTNGKPHWGRLLWRQEYNQAVLNYQQPVIRSGELLGILSVWVSTRQLSEFLSQLQSELGPNAFILHGKDQVLAHPLLSFGYPDLNLTNPLPRLNEFSDPVVSAMWSRTEQDTFLGHLLSRQKVRTVAYGDQDYIIFYKEMTGYSDRPLLVATYFEAHDLAAEVTRLKWAIIFGLLVTVIASAAAAYIGHRIARPVRRLAEGAKKVHSLDLASVNRIPRSFFLELDDAALSFNVMLDGLKWFERYVPKGLVKQLMKQNPDAEIKSSYREVVVMFTDIAGFTSLSENLTAPATADFLNDHFTMIAGCVEAEGGTVDNYIGDSVMAVWGMPARLRGSADRACRCALEISRKIDEFNRCSQSPVVRDQPLRLRIGIHQGRVMVGNIGSSDRVSYTVIGDPVNVAQRLMEAGKTLGDTNGNVNVLVSGSVRKALVKSYNLEHLGPQTLRGRKEQVQVHVL
ncbi:MAG: adenylate/guanylate cyclase domain-containing protein, partial [Alphaproteobacteria bacterium]